MIRSDWGVHPVLAIKPSHVQQLKDTWQDRFWCKLSASSRGPGYNAMCNGIIQLNQ